MTDTATNTAVTVSARFTILWLLSAIMPALLYVASLYILAPHMADSPWAEIAVLLPVPVWLLVGLLQFPLLRTRLRHAWGWIAATFVGGAIGHVAGGLSRIRIDPYVEEQLLLSELGSAELPAWAVAVYPAVPLILAGAVNLAVIAILQSFCFDKGMSGRVVWILAAVLVGILGPSCTALLGWNLLELLIKVGPPEALPRWFPVRVLAIPLAPIINFTIYGMITGLVMRWLLIRRASRQAHAMVGQFD